ncbi:helix-turn-helix transcriptional regulator [Litoribacter ruber]|uniref:helix-turn-helix transcriptional regulator n=1 Tax=Litoribacter ruber TaxID=702568 RepID=UPI001BD99D7D|nr:helix-turn-helix transcriptional regulator [Litoribacter ruber]MBT0809701.1 helix-turn-helix transcriptional regulator [Litoribacter ruber]
MKSFQIQIKNMVCPRCIKVVRQKLEQYGLVVQEVELGYAKISSPDINLGEVSRLLEEEGFELIPDQDGKTVETIKHTVLQYFDSLVGQRVVTENLSEFIAFKLHKNYFQLSKLFSQIEGRSIESYYLALKIEKVKELLEDKELTLSEISDRLQYSSVQYLSTQFKKLTGLSPSAYRSGGSANRKGYQDL